MMLCEVGCDVEVLENFDRKLTLWQTISGPTSGLCQVHLHSATSPRYHLLIPNFDYDDAVVSKEVTEWKICGTRVYCERPCLGSAWEMAVLGRLELPNLTHGALLSPTVKTPAQHCGAVRRGGATPHGMKSTPHKSNHPRSTSLARLNLSVSTMASKHLSNDEVREGPKPSNPTYNLLTKLVLHRACPAVRLSQNSRPRRNLPHPETTYVLKPLFSFLRKRHA
jgi:hypothetical protein